MIKTYADLSALLLAREWRRMLMEPSRIVGMLMQPLIFLVVFGLGFHHSFSLKEADNISYSAFFYPGVLGLVVLFSSIYATLTLVDDKKCGFFRLVLISPGGVGGAILAKVLATCLLGFCQSLLFLGLLIFLPINMSLNMLLMTLVFLLLGSLCFAVLGVIFAWLSPSASAFHALMSVVLIPMWLISGAMFPLDNPVLAKLAWLNPMAHLVTGLRSAMLGLDGQFLLAKLGAFILLFSLILIFIIAKHDHE